MKPVREKRERKPYRRPAIHFEKPVQASAATCQGPTFKRVGGKDEEGNSCEFSFS